MATTEVMEVSDRKSSDRISNLPDELIDDILTRLPLRDAVRTSILSRKWRYNWTSISHLILDHTLWKETEKNVSAPRIKFPAILDQLLSLLEGPIIHCKVSIPDLIDCPEIDNLLYFLSRNKVESLELELSDDEQYKLPPSVFSCSEISELILHTCLINLPPTFEEFGNLVCLELLYVSISAKSLENLISCCPMLQHLGLEISEPLNHIEVNAPPLRYFYFGSGINSICFKNTTLLAHCQIAMLDCYDQGSFAERGKCNFPEFFGSLPVVEELILDNTIIKSLITGRDKIPERLPVVLRCLKLLVLYTICLTELDEVCYLLCILKSSPYLYELHIEASSVKGDERPIQEFLEAEFDSDIQLNQLTKVSLFEVHGKKAEIELIKLLLAKSPVLEKLLIDPCKQRISTRRWSNMMKQVTNFGKASPQAKIIFGDGNANLDDLWAQFL